MHTFIIYLVGFFYFCIATGLFLYGTHCLFLLGSSLWHGRRVVPDPQLPANPDEWPAVTVQLPIYNEMYVAERIIRAVCEFDYPAHRLQIQVLDDSTDETAVIVAAEITRQQAAGKPICHIHRTNRAGYKAGALAEGTAVATGEFIAIFDADFVPTADYLRRMVPHFQPNIAFVQARWGHLNPNDSLLTQLQATVLDAHFALEQTGRSRMGLCFNFNGTAGMWRRTALEQVGGWQADTLTEDVDLSYRALLGGWQAIYVPDVVVLGELPVSAQGFRRQQHRWARGSLECAIKLLPAMWRSPQKVGRKLAATFHLTGYGVHLLLFALLVMYPVLLLMDGWAPRLISLAGLAYWYGATAVVPPIFFWVGQRRSGRAVRGRLGVVLLLTTAGAGLMLNTVRAAVEIILRKQITFERTAKFGTQAGQTPTRLWMRQRYTLTADTIPLWELTLAFISATTAAFAIRADHWGMAFYAALFGSGLGYMAMVTLWQNWQIKRALREQ